MRTTQSAIIVVKDLRQGMILMLTEESNTSHSSPVGIYPPAPLVITVSTITQKLERAYTFVTNVEMNLNQSRR